MRRLGRAEPVRREPAAHFSSVFSPDAALVRWFGERIIQAVANRPPLRILDVGCGDASLLLHLARAMPEASLVGVDLSSGNVAAAHELLAESPEGPRIAVICGDYLTLNAGKFDLVIALSSFQGMNTTTGQLAAKLASDTASGGLVIHMTPYRCAYNTSLNMLRRMLRLVRGPATDRIIVTAAQIVHPRQPTARLRERVDYMYLVLRHDEDALRAALQRQGFALAHAGPAPHTSIGQPKHRLAIMSAPPRG